MIADATQGLGRQLWPLYREINALAVSWSLPGDGDQDSSSLGKDAQPAGADPCSGGSGHLPDQDPPQPGVWGGQVHSAHTYDHKAAASATLPSTRAVASCLLQ